MISQDRPFQKVQRGFSIKHNYCYMNEEMFVIDDGQNYVQPLSKCITVYEKKIDKWITVDWNSSLDLRILEGDVVRGHSAPAEPHHANPFSSTLLLEILQNHIHLPR